MVGFRSEVWFAGILEMTRGSLDCVELNKKRNFYNQFRSSFFDIVIVKHFYSMRTLKKKKTFRCKAINLVI